MFNATTPNSQPDRSQTADTALEQRISERGPWFHNLHLPDGTQTCPDHWLGDFPAFKWQQIAPFIPEDLTGQTCLDIGCNAGFYTFELARRGATVLGIDAEERYLDQARWAAEQFGLRRQVHFKKMQVYDLAHHSPDDGTASDAQAKIHRHQFDLVLFMGVFYHLRYPLLALDIVAARVKGRMIFQTLEAPGDEVFAETCGRHWNDRHLLQHPGWPKMAFLEYGFAGDPTNWWAPNHAAVEAMLRSSGMKVLERPGHEIYLCEPDPDNPSPVTTWDAGELRAATGNTDGVKRG